MAKIGNEKNNRPTIQAITKPLENRKAIKGFNSFIVPLIKPKLVTIRDPNKDPENKNVGR